ncbi:MAG: histidine phosphatase family protein, partial [Burkholderiales bacterium]
PGRSSAPAREIADAELVKRLRAGGLTLYFRHMSTDFSRDDTKSRGPEDCENQRPLTDAGRADARAIGAAIRALELPLGDVLASPTCRTVETATLLFGRATPSLSVRGGPAGMEPARWRELRQLLVTRPASGNRAIASHGNPIYAVAGAPYLGESEALVIQPLPGDFEVIARLRRADWERLVR